MADEPLLCVVENPKGSRNKYEWDTRLGAIRLDRFLFSSIGFPADYGFVPETVGRDGEPLNAIVLVSAPTFPGCVIEVHPVGVLRTSDEQGQDDKLVCVPHGDPAWNGMEDVDDVPQPLRKEIARFFAIYKEPEGVEVEVGGFEDRAVAERLLDEARARWRDAQ